MRAKFVRGQSPKEAMRLGLFEIIRDGWDKVQLSPGIGSINLQEYQGDWHFVFRISPMPGFDREASIEKYLGDYLKYKDRFIKGGEYYFPIKKEFVSTVIAIYNDKYPEWKLTESVNFERGQNPIEAMGIGLKSRLKKEYEAEGFVEFSLFNLLLWSITEYKDHYIQPIIDLGADIHEKNGLALKQAAYTGNAVAVRILMDNGIDIHLDNDFALRKAAAKVLHGAPTYQKIVEMLIKEYKGPYLQKILKWAAGRKDPRMLALITRMVRKNESIEFKRGQDPKAALKIGFKAPVKKGDAIEGIPLGSDTPIIAIATEDEHTYNNRRMFNIVYGDLEARGNAIEPRPEEFAKTPYWKFYFLNDAF